MIKKLIKRLTMWGEVPILFSEHKTKEVAMTQKSKYEPIQVLRTAAVAFKKFCRKEGLKIHVAAADALRIYMQMYRDERRKDEKRNN